VKLDTNSEWIGPSRKRSVEFLQGRRGITDCAEKMYLPDLLTTSLRCL
jgi:hypothetical protein